MKHSFRVLVGLGSIVVFLAGFTGSAGAQDDAPSLVLSGDDITVTEGEGDAPDTYTVPTAGTYDVTVAGAGFSIDVFVLQCPGAAGSLEAMAEGDASSLCDLGNLMPASPDADGAFEVTFEGVEIDDCGLVFAAGDAAQTESGVALLEVEDAAADVVCDVVEAAGYDEDVSNTDAEVLGETETNDALASTGVNSLKLVTIGVVLLLAGWVAIGRARRVSARHLTP